MIELTGNELGWILRLAEKCYDDNKFRVYITKYNLKNVDKFLKLLLLRFHPNHFNAGTSKTKWILLTKEELEEIKTESSASMREDLDY